MKDTLKSSEPTILAAVGVGTLVMLAALAYVLYARPSYLYMPLYDDFDDKNSDVVTEDHEETEMGRGSRTVIALDRVPTISRVYNVCIVNVLLNYVFTSHP